MLVVAVVDATLELSGLVGLAVVVMAARTALMRQQEPSILVAVEEVEPLGHQVTLVLLAVVVLSSSPFLNAFVTSLVSMLD